MELLLFDSLLTMDLSDYVWPIKGSKREKDEKIKSNKNDQR